MSRTREEKKEWFTKMQSVAKRVKEMTPSKREEMAIKFGTITCEGRSLSPFNCCYLWLQAGKALAQVGGFKQWQRVGRQVIPGERASGYIYVPMGNKKDEADDNDRPSFRLVPVFDVTQTEVMA